MPRESAWLQRCARHFQYPDVDWLVKDRDRLQFGDGCERGAQVCLVALRVGWRDGDVNVVIAGVFRGVKRGETL